MPNPLLVILGQLLIDVNLIRRINRDRELYVVENFDDDSGYWNTVPDADTVPDDPGDRPTDVNRITATSYHASGQIAELTAVDPSHDGDRDDDQVTTYVYGTDPQDGDDPSEIASGGLLRAIIYPDSDDTADPLGDGPDEVYDRVELAYNRVGDLIQRKDQREVVRQFDYDKLGRLTDDRVTDTGRPGENVDDEVLRISRTYEARGMLASVTSHDHEEVGQGSVLNEVGFSYDDFGRLVGEEQAHAGEADGSEPQVQYSHADGSDNIARPTGLTYPDGRELTYDYGSAGEIDDRLGRLAAIEDDDTTTLAAYQYLGRSQAVTIDYTEPDVKLEQDIDGNNTYAALDRFGRIVEQRWRDDTASTDLAHHAHAYDRASNRLYREDLASSGSMGGHHDEHYAYDQFNRLRSHERGELNQDKDGIVSSSRLLHEDWVNMDGLGNWINYNVDEDGDGDLDLANFRFHNAANEITNIMNTVGDAWHLPAHDAAGNMIEMPRADEPTDGVDAVYDAWNRLVELIDEDSQDTLAKYQWDGMGRRIAVVAFDGGAIDETRHYYYTQQHQIIEVRVDGTSGGDLAEQYVWGLRYIDELVLRDRDTTGNGDVDERLYALQEANFNVVAIVDETGSIQERYRYTPYGQRTALNANFTVHTDPQTGGHAFAIGHQGLHHDGEAGAGLIYNRARMLHTALGRFVQRDPINKNMPGGGYQDGLNLYQYVRSNPVRHVDLTGLESCELDYSGRSFSDSVQETRNRGIYYDHFAGYYSATPTQRGVRITAFAFGVWVRAGFFADHGAIWIDYRVDIGCEKNNSGECEISCDANYAPKTGVDGHVRVVAESSCSVASDRKSADVSVSLGVGYRAGSHSIPTPGGNVTFPGALWESSGSGTFSYECECPD